MPVFPGTTRRRRQPIPISFDSGAVADPRIQRMASSTELAQTEFSSTSSTAEPVKSVFFFGDGRAERTKDMKAILGGKGANLAEMTNLGVPVPPGFTIACSLCIDYLRDRCVPDALRTEVTSALARLERVTSQRFGD